jgi:hypothetical protein
MLSDMESNSAWQNPGDARSALAAADQARQRLAAGLRLPAGLRPALAAAVALQLGTAAYGAAAHTAAGLAVAMAGAAVFLGVAALALRRFRRVNGVRVDGLASQLFLGAGAASTLVYAAGFGAAMWAALESRWWLVGAAAAAGGAGYAYAVGRWWRAYRRDPARLAGGASPRLLAVLAAVACLGLAALLAAG